MGTLLTLLVLANMARPTTTPLKIDPYLTRHAQIRAEYLCATKTFTHDGWYSSLFWDKGHLKYQVQGENLAQGFIDATTTKTNYNDVQAAFMASPEHRDNILGDYTAVGFGHACNITVEEFGGYYKN